MNPSPEAVIYAAFAARTRREAAVLKLLTGEHLEHVASLVCEYCDDRTPDQVAYSILSYLASELLAPLLGEGSMSMVDEDEE